MIKSISNFLVISLLLIGMPMPTKATDSRETGLIVIGAAAACAGLYLLCKENCEVTAGMLLIAFGAAGVLASKEILKDFDYLSRQMRGERSLADDVNDFLRS